MSLSTPYAQGDDRAEIRQTIGMRRKLRLRRRLALRSPQRDRCRMASHAITRRPALPPCRGAARACRRELVEQPRILGERTDEPARDPHRLVAMLRPRRLRPQLASADPLGPALADHAGLPPL